MDPIKTEPDLEDEIPRFVTPSSSIPSSVETVDLTNDEYFGEFINFLENIRDHRKQTTKKRTRQLKHISDVISLQVVHLQLTSFYQDSYVCSLFGIDFKNVMVYGRVTPGTVKQENNTQIYKLDDGTGIVEVHYAHGLKRDLDNLIAVHSCEKILTTRTPLNEEQVPNDPQELAELKLLLTLVKSRCQQRLQYFPLGTRCFAVGRPFLNRYDRVSLYAYSMHADNNPVGKSAEVFWKTHLAQCYEQRYAPAIAE
ncbi:uncharacterized protein LOC135709800 [Ochlerotatus camptorhynchus]|uniref:uncharacterized protein LOC135709800 n=1 Tax=Ochlerotatus camptorhynchus TaxID=644619 RepID=UPI0031D8CE7E